MNAGAMIVKLQCNADDIVTFLFQQAGNDRRIDAAGHGHDDACVLRPLREIKAVHGESFRLHCTWLWYPA